MSPKRIACILTASALFGLSLSTLAAKLPIEGGPKTALTDSQVTFQNNSEWAINELYFARVSSNEWGSDQLGKKTVATGDSFTLTQIPCGAYDVKLVDEDGDSCEINQVQLCADSPRWSISDKDLIKCQGIKRK